MINMLNKLKNNLILAISVMMALGLGYGLIFPDYPLRFMIIPFTLLMVYPMMVTLKLKKVIEGGDNKAQILTQVINFAIIPFISFFIGRAFFPESPYIVLGILLIGVIPTSGMTISWTVIAKGNVEAAIKMTVLGLILGAIATPFYLKFLLGSNIDLDLTTIFKQIAIVAIIPLITGYLTQQIMIKKYGTSHFRTKIAPVFPTVSLLGVLGIVFIAISLKAQAIVMSPQLLLEIALPLIILYFINYSLSTIIGKRFLSREDSIAMVYGSVMRNLSIALAISINAFGSEGSTAALVIAIAFMIQVQSAAWYAKFTNKIFKSPIVNNKTIGKMGNSRKVS